MTNRLTIDVDAWFEKGAEERVLTEDELNDLAERFLVALERSNLGGDVTVSQSRGAYHSTDSSQCCDNDE